MHNQPKYEPDSCYISSDLLSKARNDPPDVTRQLFLHVLLQFHHQSSRNLITSYYENKNSPKVAYC